MTRDERLAANEARFREINEGSRAISDTDPNSIYCECSDRGCVYRVTIDVEKYVEVRADDRRFIVRPGHEVEAIETVVERHADFFVVEKPGSMDHIISQ